MVVLHKSGELQRVLLSTVDSCDLLNIKISTD